MIARLAWGLGLFIGSLAVGWWLGARQVITERRAERLLYLVVKGVAPVVLWLSFWRLDLTHRQPLLLPLVGLCAVVATLLPAWGYCRWAKLSRPESGSFLTCALFSNLGFLGTFIAFAAFGEEAYGLATLYLVFFTPCYYVLGFSIAKRFGHRPDDAGSTRALSDELRLYPFVGLLLGVCCSVAKLPRPGWCEPVNQVLIPISTVLYLMAIGSHLRLEPPGRWWPACLVMSAIKFWYTPLVGAGLVWLCGLQGLPRFIVLLQTSMPVAVSPLMLPMLFGLDRKLANALWLTTTLLAIPWMLLYLPWIR